MVKLIGNRQRTHLYIDEWMAATGMTDQKLADRLESSRTTIWRWRTQQHRLNPKKIAALAWALNRQPEDLWRLPSRPSLDALVHNESDEIVGMAADVVQRIIVTRKAS